MLVNPPKHLPPSLIYLCLYLLKISDESDNFRDSPCLALSLSLSVANEARRTHGL